ncbi:hypothetical protein CY35_08G127300 [Sphagnum magellanicum]|nr:hypothetical protein CY35_08G127300 [Sphagnum magellanicum]
MKPPLNPSVPSSVPVVPLSILPIDDGFGGVNFLSLGTGTSSSPPAPPAGKVHKDLENHEINLNSPLVDQLQQQFSEVKNCKSSRGNSLNSKFQQQEVLVYRGVRHRSELNKWVTEIRPTAHKRKIWLGTYKSPEEAARVYDVQIHYTGKKIPLNFPEFVKNLPELPQGLSWEELAPFVKKQALTAAK